MAGQAPVAYIDADIILHRAVSFCGDEFDGDRAGDSKEAEWYFDGILERWLRDMGRTEGYVPIITVGKNFRYGLYPDYKGNRKDIIPHPAFGGLKDRIMDRLDVVWEEGIEADDLIGIRVTEEPNRVAVSADKDFATIPCRLFIPASHGKTRGSWFRFTEDEANLNWLRQAMTGDTIDNYKGIPGVGAVKASTCLPKAEPVEVMWSKVVSLFKEKKLSEADALLMARLARILRAGEYDFDTKEVSLWTPVN